MSTRRDTAGPPQRDVGPFLAVSHGWTWAFWGVAALWGRSVWDIPAVLFFIAGGAGVFLGGIVMSRVTYGKAGLADLWRRLVDPARIGARWWAAVLLLYPALTCAAAALAFVLGASERPLDPDAAARRLADPANLLAMMGSRLSTRSMGLYVRAGLSPPGPTHEERHTCAASSPSSLSGPPRTRQPHGSFAGSAPGMPEGAGT